MTTTLTAPPPEQAKPSSSNSPVENPHDARTLEDIGEDHLGVHIADNLRLMADNQKTLDRVGKSSEASRRLEALMMANGGKKPTPDELAKVGFYELLKQEAVDDMGIRVSSPSTINYNVTVPQPPAPPTPEPVLQEPTIRPLPPFKAPAAVETPAAPAPVAPASPPSFGDTLRSVVSSGVGRAVLTTALGVTGIGLPAAIALPHVLGLFKPTAAIEPEEPAKPAEPVEPADDPNYAQRVFKLNLRPPVVEQSPSPPVGTQPFPFER